MPMNDTHTPVLDHGFTVDEIPGWTLQDMGALQRIEHSDRLAARLKAQGVRKRVTETRIEFAKGACG